MPNLPELVQNATPGASKCKKKKNVGGLQYPQGDWPHLTLTPTWHYVRSEMAALPPFLVPAITTIVLAISNLSKNPNIFTFVLL